ncbi:MULTISPECIES: hypothetical protein [unclassified Lentimonas]|uniref:hypothetical protein n=1 Tax=unclassified Lentimonas TaxID=2630993 RepID=UPI0013297A68|nr:MULTISPECIES: hypothetical protein [unclassified Lentimonas]CAA6691794.1 Unannotated [Lentimonas sp. CC19]CAA6694541.1 Unannotated [Lentimonas sp. CC10]CAA7072083.1 Unannotated [Lentimonas sp. CC11]
MKNILRTLSFCALSALTVTATHALDLSKFTDKATDVISGSDTSSTDLLKMSSDMLKSFSGNEQATSAAKGLLKSFNAEDYLGAFDYYDQIKDAGLTPAQLQTWNDVKNPLSAVVLERNFDFKDSGLSDLVSKATNSLKNNDTKGANNYLSQLKEAASLTSGQKSLLQKIQSNLLPVK